MIFGLLNDSLNLEPFTDLMLLLLSAHYLKKQINQTVWAVLKWCFCPLIQSFMSFKCLFLSGLVLVANVANANYPVVVLLFPLNKQKIKNSSLKFSPYCVISDKTLYDGQLLCRWLPLICQSSNMVDQPVLNQRWGSNSAVSELLAGHPQGEGDEEGGQGRAGGESQTRHGQESQQRRQDDAPLVPDQRLQPLTELEERELIKGKC